MYPSKVIKDSWAYFGGHEQSNHRRDHHEDHAYSSKVFMDNGSFLDYQQQCSDEKTWDDCR